MWQKLATKARLVIVLALLSAGTPLYSQTPRLKLETGKEIYQAACVACHGPDGKGAPQSARGFEPPPTFPDFTNCRATAREPNVDWSAIIHNGGPVKGFSEIMPSFKEALTDEQIEKVIEYLRGFCREDSWPRGELNLPRPLVTEKAFLEDEVVVESAINTSGNARVASQLVYEKRFGIRNQIELKTPFTFQRADTRTWFGGLGDVTLGYKRVLASNIQSGSIFSAAGEIVLPVGNKARDLGGGVTVFEGFAAYGQILPKESFLQFQAGFEAPTNTADAARAVFWRSVLGRSFVQGGDYNRIWSPMVELLADREFAAGERIHWDIAPQFQVTLSKRQHIRANFGVRFPLNNTGSRSAQLMFYLLWDWFDGGLRDGW